MRVLLGSVAAAVIVLGLLTSGMATTSRCEMASSLPAPSPDRIAAHGCEAVEIARQQEEPADAVVLAKIDRH